MPDPEVTAPRGSMIEQHSIDYIPHSERHGKVWHQGPRMGLPQMIQSRAQFGSRGSVVPFAATVFVYVGFLVFDTILATQGIGLVAPTSKFLWYPLLIALSILIAVIGHDLLHFVQRWLTYILVVVFAIVTLVDFYFVRRGTYAIAEILKPNGLYRRWAWRGVVAYSVGFLVMIPFFSVGFFVGPIAQLLGGADFSFALGLVVAGGLYLIFSRSLDRAAEETARRASNAELEGTLT